MRRHTEESKPSRERTAKGNNKARQESRQRILSKSPMKPRRPMSSCIGLILVKLKNTIGNSIGSTVRGIRGMVEAP